MGGKCVRPCFRGSDEATEDGLIGVVFDRSSSSAPSFSLSPSLPGSGGDRTFSFSPGDVGCWKCVRDTSGSNEFDAPNDTKTSSPSIVSDPRISRSKDAGAPTSNEASERLGPRKNFRRQLLIRQLGNWAQDASPNVILNIYALGHSNVVSALNKVLQPMGSGVYHCGVEVYGREWSFSDTESGQGTGVFFSKPRECPDHRYLESVSLGKTDNSQHAVIDLILHMARDWSVSRYNTLSYNCCHFCNEFSQRLGVGGIPQKVLNLAGFGAALVDVHDGTLCKRVAEDVTDNCCCQDGDFDTIIAETAVMRDTSKSKEDLAGLVQGWRL